MSFRFSDISSISSIHLMNGFKVLFDPLGGSRGEVLDGSFVIGCPSGTNPLLRIFAEANDYKKAKKYIQAFRELLYLD